MTLDEMRRRLQPMNLAEVSRETGINYHTLRRLASGESEPRYQTADHLAQWLKKQGAA